MDCCIFYMFSAIGRASVAPGPGRLLQQKQERAIRGNVYPYSADLQAVERHLIARDARHKLSLTENMTSVFDTHGTEILRNSGKRDVIVMDELGFLESKALAFRQVVMRHISGNVPVLGVIKPMQTEFLNAIRSHSSVKLREVTVENRDAVLTWLLEQNQR